MRAVPSLVAESAALEERLGKLSPESADAEALLWKHHELQEKIEASGYHGRREGMHRVLTGLGFSVDDFAKPCAAFSAGWQMRIALARAILEAPDILLLDEPTNYLDIEARTWLEGFLAEFPGGLLLVSHDRYFLDVVVSAVAEIYMTRVAVFNGNYSRYEEMRSRELEALMERWRAQQEEISHIEAFINRFRYNASKARLVQSRITQLSKIERIEIPPIVKSIHFAFPAPPPSGRRVLAADGLEKSYAGRRVFGNVGFEVSRGDKLVVVGVNGAGKSTLLRIVSGREEPDAGTLQWGTGVVPAFYSQENADAWTSDRQVIEELESAAPTSLIPELRTLLGSFLFRGDDVFKSVAVLSGGERSRLSMLLLLLRPANLLILDEPTNHLDLASKDVLLDALRDFAGTVIFVSHDRHFISHLATAVLEVKDGCARYLPGDYEYYLSKSAQGAGAEPVPASGRGAGGDRRPDGADRGEASQGRAPRARTGGSGADAEPGRAGGREARHRGDDGPARCLCERREDEAAAAGPRGEPRPARRRHGPVGKGRGEVPRRPREDRRPQDRYSFSMTPLYISVITSRRLLRVRVSSRPTSNIEGSRAIFGVVPPGKWIPLFTICAWTSSL